MANYFTKGNVAVVEADNQPVNALGFKLRKGIYDGVKRANADPQVKSIVLCGKGRTFPSGADISEFGQAWGRSSPSLVEVCHALENSEKPVVAATHGFILGGGLEVAISCHYRITQKDAQFGFPEVTLGILPAAEGTQRFPRLVGLEAALRHIPTGDRFRVKQAQKYGMINKVVDKNLLEEAIQFARNVQGKPIDHLRVSKMAVRDGGNAKALAEAAMRRVSQKSKGILAPVYNVKSVMASVELPWEKGIQKEAQYAALLFMSGQAHAQQYAFFAQRAATKWSLPGVNPSTVRPLPVKTAAVVGAGTMGTGIAMALLNAGIPVTLLEQNDKFLKAGVKTLTGLYAGSVKLGKMTEGQMKAIMDRVTPTVEYRDLKDVDLVIEAVYENMQIKKDVFSKLDSVCKPSTILCTNTSYLNIDEIASATKRPGKVVGTHFFVPAYYMKMLENVRGKNTSPETIATVMQLGQRMGKVPVLVGNCFGFVGNRMMSKYTTEATFLVEEGASPSQVDEVLENFGMTLGVMKVKDLSGIDIGWRVKQEVAKMEGREPVKTRFINGERTSYLDDIMCEHGRFGRKAGAGWYRYERPGAKDAFHDPWVEQAVQKYREENGIIRRRISTQEIEERCFYSMINEAFKILDEGIASKPQDVDTIWLLGYGFPRQMGGPMFYANQVGVAKVYDRVCHYYKQHPHSPHWQPSELLRRVAMNNTPMDQWISHVSSKL